MILTEHAEVLLVIRLIASAVFVDFYARYRSAQRGVLALGWIFYLISALARLGLALHPALMAAIAGMCATVGIALIGLAGLAYVRAAVLRIIPYVAAAVVLLMGAPIAVAGMQPVHGVVIGMQAAVILVVLAGALRLYRRALRRLQQTWLLFLAGYAVGLIVIVVNFAGVNGAAWFSLGTLSANILLLLFFVFAEHKRALAREARAAMRLRHAEQIAGIGYWERDLHSGRAEWSAGHYRIFGLAETQVPPSIETFLHYVHPQDRDRVEQENSCAVAGERSLSLQYRIVRPDGVMRWVLADTDYDPKANHIFGLVMDITALKQSQLQLERLLSEKTTLLSEVHHRVKNNLQVVLSLLRLKLSDSRDAGTGAIVADIERRIQSMVDVHEKLLSFNDLARIEMRPYLGDLVTHVRASYLPPGIAVQVELHIDHVRLSADLALPCGLIAAELVANCCRHAFADGTAGSANTIRVEFSESGRGYTLRVCDNGRGLPQDSVGTVLNATGGSPRLGMAFVQTFAAQLHGKIELHGQEGTQVTLRFPRRDG